MILFRRAVWNDHEALLDLIEEGFAVEGNKVDINEGLEHRTLFSYLYNRPTWNPEWLYVAELDGKLLAAVGYFPQTLFFESIAIPAGAISPVVTAPKYRSQGLARECLNQMMNNLKPQGVSLVFLWGLPFYYPKLGFVPVLPRYKTKITLKQLITSARETSGKFRECKLEDLKDIAELYQHSQYTHWLQPARSLEWWHQQFTEIGTDNAFIKEVPFPKKENFLVWENTLGELSGYLNYSSEYSNYILQSSNQKVVINEAAVKDLNSATAMVKDFLNRIEPAQTLYVRGTPEHTLNAAVYKLGGIHLNPAPLAGMVKVIDWPQFLKFLDPLFQQRISNIKPVGEEFNFDWAVDEWVIQFVVKGDVLRIKITEKPTSNEVNHNELLTRLIFGLYQHFEIPIKNNTQTELLSELFPQKYPFIWDVNYLY
jgi:predicted N-acetyltransferase YhbS